MTDAQKFHFYFPAWNACVKANGWRKVKGRLVGNGLEPSTLDLRPSTDELAKVLIFAQQRATMDLRGLAVEDIRHGAHILALGKDKSSEHLTDDDLDRCVCLFNVLADPLFLGTEDKFGRVQWDAYQRGENPGAERRINWMIRSIPEALARKIAVDMIHTRNWESADIEHRRILARRISQYKRNQRARIGGASLRASHQPVAAGHVPDPENEPF